MRLTILTLLAITLFSCIGSPDWYYRRGLAEYNLGHLDKALSHFGKTLEQNPKDAKTLYAVGWIFNLKGKHDQAFLYFRRCEAADSNYYACYKGLAANYLAIGMDQKAEVELTRALNLSPENPSILSNLADIEFSRENYPEALKYYKRAIAKDPDRGELYYGAGRTYIMLGQDDQALIHLKRGLRANLREKRFKAQMHYLVLGIYLRKIDAIINPQETKIVSKLDQKEKRKLKRNIRKARATIFQIHRLDPTRKGLKQFNQALDQIETKYL